MFSIGEFSKISQLPVKTLRFYHEKGLLVPAAVDPETGYRFYDRANVDKARVIVALRALEFSLDEIREILESCDDDADILDHLEKRRAAVRDAMSRHRDIERTLERMIQAEKEARSAMRKTTFEVEEKTLEDLLVAGIRMRGRYSDCGRGFARLAKAVGRYIRGKPLCLYYDGEYREDDADIEPCFPLGREIQVDGVAVRRLPGGRCVSLLHKGPYDELGRSYARAIEYAKERGYEVILPTRETYLKGPGMIFKGNPRRYLTEIQLLVRETPQT